MLPNKWIAFAKYSYSQLKWILLEKPTLRDTYVRGKINEELAKKILGDEEPVTCRYADLLEPGIPAAKEYLGDRATCDEDVLSYIAFPAQTEAFFDKRDEKKKNTFSYTIKKID